MKLVVGCPVYKRDWIIERWDEHVQNAVAGLDLDLQYCFVVSRNDWDTLDQIALFDPPTVRIYTDEANKSSARNWDRERYYEMVDYRNVLLEQVRYMEPELFLSLDSDILLAPSAIRSALSAFREDTWAVGLATYLTPGDKNYPNNGIWMPNDRYRRYDTDDIASVDILMAAKLMKPQAYNIDYVFHRNGEDLGWSRAVTEAGGKFLWDGRVKNKHVMSPELLEPIDPRCGF